MSLPQDRRLHCRVVIPGYAAFNIYSAVARKTTALGPVSIATVINKMPNWDVEVIDENNYRRFGPRDASGRPDHAVLQRLRPADVVGFYGGLTSTIPRLYELALFYKKQGAITIAGGQHFIGENARAALTTGLDYVVLGEGEITIQELLQTLRAGGDPADVAGIAFLRGGELVQTPERTALSDFDPIPLPDFSLVRYAKLTLFPVGWVRGCGMNCEFCTVKGKVRAPPPEYVFEQIASLLERHSARHFFIVDDLFGQDRAATLRLCEMLKEYQRTVRTRLDLTVQIRLDKARDAELLGAMRGAGINSVAIGFESPIPDELAAMNKRTKPEEMLELTRRFRKAGFLVHGMFIFGYPLPTGATLRLGSRERVRAFRRFIRKARIDTIQILLPVPLPGTAMTQRLAQQHRIFSSDVVGWEYYDGNFPLFTPDEPLTPEEMQASIRDLMGRFYRFKHMFSIGLNIMVFPAMVFFLHNLKSGWRLWYRGWRNDLLRFAGWIIIRRWTSEFKKGVFSRKLCQAKAQLTRPPPR